MTAFRCPAPGFSLYLAATVDASGKLHCNAGVFPVSRPVPGRGRRLEGPGLHPGGLRAAGQARSRRQRGDRWAGAAVLPVGGQKLTPGLYLVLGSRREQNGRVYDPQPFLVMLPTLDKETGERIYRVRVSPKYEVRPDVPGVVSRKALKVWRDEGQEANRPKDITVRCCGTAGCMIRRR